MAIPVVLSYFAQSANPGERYLEALKKEYNSMRETWENCDLEIDYKDRLFTEIDTLPKDIELYHKDLIAFHFSGHAGSQQLSFEDGPGYSDGIAGLLGAAPNLKLVFMNGCATQSQVDLLFENDVKVVIATRGRVGDELAMQFAAAFYKTLCGVEKTIQQAFDFALATIKLSYGNDDDVKSATSDPIVWRGSLVTGTENNRDRWELHVKEDNEHHLSDPYWWVIGNMTLSRPKPEDSALPKLFFIYDKDTEEEYKTFEDELFRETYTKKILINGSLGIQPQLNKIAIKDEVHAADVVFLLIRDSAFITLWSLLELTSKDLQDKFIVFINISGPEFSLETLKNKRIEASATIPSVRWARTFPTLDKADKGFKKMMLRDVYMENIEEVINKLPKYIDEFNFVLPKKAFKTVLTKQNQFFFVSIEGTINCGHNMLLRKMEENFRIGNVPLIKKIVSLKIYSVQTQDDLVAAISKEFRIEDNFYNSLVSLSVNNDLLIVIDDLLFQNNSGIESTQNHADLIVSFFKSLSNELSGKINNRILLIALNRKFDGTYLFDKYISTETPEKLPLVSCKLEPVNIQEITDWKKDKDPTDTILSKLSPENLETDIKEPRYFIPTLTKMGLQLQIPAKVLAKIIE